MLIRLLRMSLLFLRFCFFCGCCHSKLPRTWMLAVSVVAISMETVQPLHGSAESKRQGNTDKMNSRLCSGNVLFYPMFSSKKDFWALCSRNWSRSFELFWTRTWEEDQVGFHTLVSSGVQFLVHGTSTGQTPWWRFLCPILEYSEWVVLLLHWVLQEEEKTK